MFVCKDGKHHTNLLHAAWTVLLFFRETLSEISKECQIVWVGGRFAGLNCLQRLSADESYSLIAK